MSPQWDDYHKFWILKKINHFLRRDACFRYLSAEALLAPLHHELIKSSSLADLARRLQRAGLDDEVSLPRKAKEVGAYYFHYPPMSFQISSMIACWDAIAQFQKSSPENLDVAIENQDVELGIDVDSLPVDPHRVCFGHKPNYEIAWDTDHLPSNEIRAHERSLGAPLEIHFRYEYCAFRKSAVQMCRTLLRRSQKVLVVQTDIEAFYHNLEIDFLILFFRKKRFPRPLIDALQEIKTTHTTLPIGWILSGFLANFLLRDMHETLKPLMRGGRSLSYVDDFVFFKPLQQVDAKSEEQQREIANSIIERANQSLAREYSGKIRFYTIDETQNRKARCFSVDSGSVTRLVRNFVDMGMSVVPTEMDVGFELHDLFIPEDPDFSPSERSHFSLELTAATKNLQRGQALDEKYMIALFDRMLIKVKKTGGRYVSRVFSILNLILDNQLEHDPSSPSKSEKMVTNFIAKLLKELTDETFCTPERARLATSLTRFASNAGFGRQMARSFLKKLGALKIPGANRDWRAYWSLLLLELATKDAKDGIADRKSQVGPQPRLPKSPSRTFRMYRQALFLRLSWARALRNGKGTFTAPHIESTPLLAAMFFREFGSQGAFDRVLRLFHSALKKCYGLGPVAGDLFLAHAAFAIFERASLPQIRSIALAVLETGRPNGQAVKFCTFIMRHSAYLQDTASLNEQEKLRRLIEEIVLENRIVPPSPLEMLTALPLHRGELFISLVYSFTCETPQEILSHLSWKMMPLEGQQWMPWRSSIHAFQRTGHSMILLLENAYRLDVGGRRMKRLTSSFLATFRSQINAFIESYRRPMRTVPDLNKVVVDLDKLEASFARLRAPNVRLTVAPISYSHELDLDLNNAFRFRSNQVRRRLNSKIQSAIQEAIDRRSSILVLPEMTVPEGYLANCLTQLADKRIVLIAGLEYRVGPGMEARNITVISVPIRKRLNPLGRSFLLFEQVKNFPAATEADGLRKSGYTYKSNFSFFLFKSATWQDFAVLMCSDFLSLTLRWLVQKEIQTLFVPAQNGDESTYRVLGDACIRDLHCIAVVCCNPSLGESFCLAPFYNRSRRTLLSHTGMTRPEFHTLEIRPEAFRNVQIHARAGIPFRAPPKPRRKKKRYEDYKQLPPDWDYF